jgi:hypothetical protein
MKIINETNYICPRCGSTVLQGNNICSQCGAQLTWSNEHGINAPLGKKKSIPLIIIILSIVLAIIIAASIISVLTRSKITSADAPFILNMAENLPQRFNKIDSAEMGMTIKDKNPGPDVSETQLFLSEEPYQMIYGIMLIANGILDRFSFDALLKDDKQFKDYLLKYLNKSAKENDVQMTNFTMSISHPSLGDVSSYATGPINIDGEDYIYSALIFRKYQVYILTVSISLSEEGSVSLIPLGTEIIKRMDIRK